MKASFPIRLTDHGRKLIASLLGLESDGELPPPRRHHVTMRWSDGREVTVEHWFRSFDTITHDDGSIEPVFGSFEVDVFDELYIDHGGPGA